MGLGLYPLLGVNPALRERLIQDLVIVDMQHLSHTLQEGGARLPVGRRECHHRGNAAYLVWFRTSVHARA